MKGDRVYLRHILERIPPSLDGTFLLSNYGLSLDHQRSLKGIILCRAEKDNPQTQSRTARAKLYKKSRICLRMSSTCATIGALRGLSSVGRALAWHARGRGFESHRLHSAKQDNRGRTGKLWYASKFECSGRSVVRNRA